MSTFSPDWAYETQHPYAQYYNGNTYPGNSVMATVGQTKVQKIAAAENLLRCPGIYLTSSVLGAAIITAYAYVTHRKLIKQKKMKVKDIWGYTIMGALATPVIMALSFFTYGKTATMF